MQLLFCKYQRWITIFVKDLKLIKQDMLYETLSLKDIVFFHSKLLIKPEGIKIKKFLFQILQTSDS